MRELHGRDLETAGSERRSLRVLADREDVVEPRAEPELPAEGAERRADLGGHCCCRPRLGACTRLQAGGELQAEQPARTDAEAGDDQQTGDDGDDRATLGCLVPGIAGRSATTEAGERALLRSVERGEWTTIANVGSAKVRYASTRRDSTDRLTGRGRDLWPVITAMREASGFMDSYSTV